MQKNLPFFWKDGQVVKGVFIAGSIYFLLTTLYSLFHYQAKFLYDGAGLIFHITNYEWFPPAAQREVFYLQQVIPVLFAKAGFSIKWVMLGYVFNVYLLYYLLFFIVARTLKDPLSAILLVLVHYKGDPYNYFIMVEELLPGACMVVVLFSILINFDSIKYRKVAIALSLLLVVLVIRAHPLAVVCLAGAIPILFLRYPEFFKRHFAFFFWTSLFGVALLLFKFLFLHSYDANLIMHERRTVWQSAVDLMNPEKLSGMLLYLFYSRKFFTIAFACTLIYLALKERYVALSVFVLVLTGVVVLFNTMVFQDSFATWQVTHMKYDQWSLPVRFVVFTAFCFLTLAEIKTMEVFKYVRAAFIFYFLLGAIQVPEQKNIGYDYLAQVDLLIEHCRKNGISKAVVHVDNLLPGVPVMHTGYQDILVYSAMKYPASCIQVLYADDEYSPPVGQIRENEIILDKEGPLMDHSALNPDYYYLPHQGYQEITIPDSLHLLITARQ